jgi:hypothetical protein
MASATPASRARVRHDRLLAARAPGPLDQLHVDRTLLEDRARRVDRRAERRAHLHDELALVLDGDEFEAQRPAQQGDRRERAEPEEHHQPARAQREAQDRPVPPLQAVEAVLEAAHDHVAAPRLREEPRREHGVEGERDEHRQQDRHRDGERERVEEPADEAAHERDRHEHGDDGQRRREHGQPDLARRLLRGDAGGRALLDVAHDVLLHHDRVVDQEADRERQAEQRHHVEREAEHGHQHERRHDRRREHERADEGAAHVEQEEEDDHDREPAAPEEVVLHLVDGLLDVRRLLLGELQPHPAARELRPERRDLGDDPPRDLDGVLARLAAHRDRHARHPVEARAGRLLLEAVLDAADVDHADRPAAGRRRDRHLRELGGGAELGGEFRDHVPRPGRDPPAGDLHVLARERGHDVADGEPVGLEADGVEPEPELAVAEADQLRGADAPEPLQPLLHLLLGEAREVLRRKVARDDDRRDRGGVDVELLDDRLLHVVGERRPHGRELRGHLLERHVDGLAELELDHDLRDVLRARRAQVLDARDRVHRLLDRVGDRALDGLGVGPGQLRDDGHDGELDPREQVDAEPAERHPSEDDEGRHHHRGEDGATDGGAREDHGALRGASARVSGRRRGAG